MQPYQKRVVQERDELAGRLVRLETFIAARMEKVDEDEKVRLRIQAGMMKGLLGILDQRIAAFGP